MQALQVCAEGSGAGSFDDVKAVEPVLQLVSVLAQEAREELYPHVKRLIGAVVSAVTSMR